MPSVQGVVKCQGNKIVGNFYINGGRQCLSVQVEPRNEEFECSDATLTYDSVAQLSGACKWSGTIGRDDLKMNFGTGLSIVGQITESLESQTLTSTSGTGTWNPVKVTLPPPPKRIRLTRHRES